MNDFKIYSAFIEEIEKEPILKNMPDNYRAVAITAFYAVIDRVQDRETDFLRENLRKEHQS